MMQQRDAQMWEFKKDDLLKIIRENRETHRSVFEAAMAGYSEYAKKVVGESLAALMEGRTPEIRIVLSRPEDHTKDYDRIIRILELDIAETVQLDERRFAQYVMDDWEWKRDWLRMSNQYAAGATQTAYGVDAVDDSAAY